MNKNYTLDDLRIIGIEEPTIKVDKLPWPNTESNDSNAITKEYTASFGDESKFFAFLPLIRINKTFMVQQSNILSFRLDYRNFLPTLRLSLADPNNELKSKYYPTDGSIISIYIASIGDEKVYKPIRLDFIITNVKENGGLSGSVLRMSNSSFDISADLYVPKIFYKNNMSKIGTSFEVLKDIALETGLGFASNISNTADKSLWLNPYSSIQNYINNISHHAYLDDESFFISFIDLSYNLNLVEVSRLFSQFPENDDCYAYSTAFYGEEHSEEAWEDETVDDIDQKIDEWVGRKHRYYYELNNSRKISSWTPYYEQYSEINSSSDSLWDGYVKYSQYWNHQSQDLINTPVSVINMETEGMMPLNKGKLVDGEASELVDNMKSYIWSGELNDHLYPNYYYAEANNRMNENDLSKFGMVVTLPHVNPAITKFSRIKLIVFEKSELAKSGLIENKNMSEDAVLENEKGESIRLKDYPELQSDTTPRFDVTTEEGKREAEKLGIYSELADKDIENADEILNESLSGWYVVTGFEIFMDEVNLEQANQLKQRVYLSRREYKPAIKADYKKVTK